MQHSVVAGTELTNLLSQHRKFFTEDVDMPSQLLLSDVGSCKRTGFHKVKGGPFALIGRIRDRTAIQ